MNFTFIDINNNQDLLQYKSQILSLFKEAFGSELSGALWDWAYQQNPAGAAYVSLCFDGDNLAGHYAVIPIILENEGKPVKGALSMTTMVGKNYQGKGLFTQQAEKVYNTLKADDTRMVIGFPNKNSAPGFKKRLAWQVMDHSRVVKLTGQDIKSNPQIREMLCREGAFSLNLSEEYLQWRLKKPASAYTKVNDGLIIKAFEGMQDIVYLTTQGIDALDDVAEYNIFIDFEDDNLASEDGFSYKFGYREFQDGATDINVKTDLLMSDVF